MWADDRGWRDGPGSGQHHCSGPAKVPGAPGRALPSLRFHVGPPRPPDAGAGPPAPAELGRGGTRSRQTGPARRRGAGARGHVGRDRPQNLVEGVPRQGSRGDRRHWAAEKGQAGAGHSLGAIAGRGGTGWRARNASARHQGARGAAAPVYVRVCQSERLDQGNR